MSYFLSGLKLEHLVLALTLQTASVGHHICGQGPRASRWDQIVGYVRLGFPPSRPAEDVLNVATAFACGQLALPIGGDDPYWAAFAGCDLNDDKAGLA